MKERKTRGEKVDDKHIRKHKNDVFRLAVLWRGDESFELSGPFTPDMAAFKEAIADDLPEKAIFKEMGIPSMSSEVIFSRLQSVFKIST